MTKKKTSTSSKKKLKPDVISSPIAVIDIGTSSIRLLIAQPEASGDMQTLEALQQEAALGEEVFNTGKISRATMESCVTILKNFRKVLAEYQISSPHQIRAVATSAVREASNREAFIDRVYIATNIEIEVIDQAEETRLTYLSVEPLIRNTKLTRNRPALIVEIGGGSTEVLLIHDHHLEYAHSYRLGALRMKEMLDGSRLTGKKKQTLMETEIQRIIEQVNHNVPMEAQPTLVILGGEARFAAQAIGAPPDAETLSTRIQTKDFGELVSQIIDMSTDEIVKKYNILYPEAETLGPSLLAYLMLARAYRARSIHVVSRTMRDGLLSEFTAPSAWTPEFLGQITRSAIDLGRRYDFDEAHALHTAELCRTLFTALQSEHQLDEHSSDLLQLSAILHEIGMYVNTAGHHKHTQYLIMNSDLFGLSKSDQTIIAMVARYHRRAAPRMRHLAFSELDRHTRILIAKLAAILRVADALDRSHTQRVDHHSISIQDSTITLSVDGLDDLSLEQISLDQKGRLFQDTYGLELILAPATQPPS